ncbi:hypothetical protein L484_012900 [Morus notabilis]|uniref:Uncharacterized protein n=1 Tax=Morus notabilis TaxID=981085 RepID=W9RFP7_9ROSA|nr:hypothetical protein L484_012900 [Morus notabilis]
MAEQLCNLMQGRSRLVVMVPCAGRSIYGDKSSKSRRGTTSQTSGREVYRSKMLNPFRSPHTGPEERRRIVASGKAASS